MCNSLLYRNHWIINWELRHSAFSVGQEQVGSRSLLTEPQKVQWCGFHVLTKLPTAAQKFILQLRSSHEIWHFFLKTHTNANTVTFPSLLNVNKQHSFNSFVEHPLTLLPGFISIGSHLPWSKIGLCPQQKLHHHWRKRVGLDGIRVMVTLSSLSEVVWVTHYSCRTSFSKASEAVIFQLWLC